jgi:hypothetical protein
MICDPRGDLVVPLTVVFLQAWPHHYALDATHAVHRHAANTYYWTWTCRAPGIPPKMRPWNPGPLDSTWPLEPHDTCMAAWATAFNVGTLLAATCRKERISWS